MAKKEMVMSPEAMAKATEDFLKTLDPVRLRMHRQFPFWAMLVERCDIRACWAIPTAGVTNSGVMYINLEFWAKLSTGQRCFLLAHEVSHTAFGHFARRGGRDPMGWNIAGDLAINLLIVEEMGTESMPENGLLNRNLKDKTTEEIYDMLPPQMKGEGGSGQGQGKKSQKAGSNGDPTGGMSVEKANAASGDMMSDDDADVADGEGHALTDARDDKCKTDADWKAAAAQAMVHAKNQGKMPAGLERVIKDRLEPKVDWVQRLSFLMRTQLVGPPKGEYGWIPPNRRFIYQDVYMPRVTDGKMPLIVWAVDTSGSMGDAELKRAVSEVDAARKQFNAMVYFMSCDADVYKPVWVRPNEELPNLDGGGGTSFIPVFEHLAKEQIDPDVLIFFTDTMGSFPTKVPEYPVLWVTQYPGAKVPFGELIKVEE